MSNQLEKIKELIDRRAAARLGGGEKAIAKQHPALPNPIMIASYCFITSFIND